ncbi:MAG: hypothetical protein GXY51_08980 [Bacteroidetes bacterium]|nr:hypothetical protein [Bacteroidota bacterium]
MRKNKQFFTTFRGQYTPKYPSRTLNEQRNFDGTIVKQGSLVRIDTLGKIVEYE